MEAMLMKVLASLGLAYLTKGGFMNKSIIIKSLSSIFLAIGLVSSVTFCFILNSGKDGINGEDGATNSIRDVDGKIEIDNKPTGYDNVYLSGMISVTSNNPNFGKVTSSNRYQLNSVVEIKAIPYQGYVFKHWENLNGEIVSTSSSLLVKAIKEEQNFIAIFEIDKENVTIEVNVRGDASLPNEVSLNGNGTYKYDEEYEISVASPSILEGTFLYFEVSKEEFDDSNYKVDLNTDKAIGSGTSVVFDVSDVFDKYYLVAYKEKDSGGISIIASSKINVSSSCPNYADAYIYKVGGKAYEEGETSIFPGDEVLVKAEPKFVYKYSKDPFAFDPHFIYERATFLYWIEASSNKILSYEKEYSFIAKEKNDIQAVFTPKTVVYVEGKYVNVNLISKNDTYSRSPDGELEMNDPVGSFDFNEDVLLYCTYSSSASSGFTNRYDKFYLEISYDGVSYDFLCFDKQCYFNTKENNPFVYIRARIDARTK